MPALSPGICGGTDSANFGHWDSSRVNHRGPDVQREFWRNSEGSCPRDNASAGLSSDRTCFQII